jgi:hypothetical protein
MREFELLDELTGSITRVLRRSFYVRGGRRTAIPAISHDEELLETAGGRLVIVRMHQGSRSSRD